MISIPLILIDSVAAFASVCSKSFENSILTFDFIQVVSFRNTRLSCSRLYYEYSIVEVGNMKHSRDKPKEVDTDNE